VDVRCPATLECVAVDQPGNAFVGSSGSLPPVPASLKPPSIAGMAKEGHSLVERHGSWSEFPTSFAYQWERCSSAGSRCVPIAFAAGPSYRLTAADAGHRIRVEEWAYNISGGGAPATSRPTAVVKPLVSVVVKRASLSGIAKGHPRLTLTLAAAVAEPRLKSVLISLPGGLTLSTGRAVTGAITVLAGHRTLKFSARLKRQSLTVSLKRTAATMRITVASAVLRASKRLATVARSHKHGTVRLVLTVAQPHSPKTHLVLRVRFS
jgi:hypothetical protein